MPPTKICNKCKKELPLDKFNQNGGGTLRPDCKDCRKKYHKKRYASDPEKFKEISKNYRRDHRDHCKARDLAHYAIHKEKRNEASRNYQKKNRPMRKEKIAEYGRKWTKNNPERMRANSLRRRTRKKGIPSNFTHKDWLACLNYWHGSCAYCGNQSGFLLETRITADHFIPIASIECPGTIPGNMLPACGSCNSSKQDSDPVKWLTGKFGSRKANQVLVQIKEYFNQLT